MKLVRLAHWKEEELAERVERLRAASPGHDVQPLTVDGAAALRGLAERPPAALVIDLGRLPSHGRDIALTVRRERR